ncbi:diguanylate cyclase domain-containing protein [Lichenicoccus sp.]|uniref:ligand-binding sensor domain-containing diguanylate cyclase n=1 Tax=Lichenicoccus sp. TaxID=2781899 RepID=UPI003D120CA6
MRWLVACFALLVALFSGRPAAAQHLDFRLFDEDSGLSDLAINALAQDQAGFIYAGTENGLFRYDGSRFTLLGKSLGLPVGGTVTDVEADPDGRVWVLFADRLYMSRGAGFTSVALDLANNDDIYHHLAPSGHDMLVLRNGRLLRAQVKADDTILVRPYFDSQPVGGAGRRAGGAGQAALQAAIKAGFLSVHVDQGAIWLQCGDTICRLQNGLLTMTGDQAGLPADRWTGLLRDDRGTLWLRSPERIASLAAGATRFAVSDIPGGSGRFGTDPGRLQLVEDAAHRLVTQSASGLLVHENASWLVYGHAAGMLYGAPSSMLLDREGSLWVGSHGRGLAQALGFGMFENWTREEGLEDDLVWNMIRDGAGTMWVATDLSVDPLDEHRRPGRAEASPRLGAPVPAAPVPAAPVPGGPVPEAGAAAGRYPGRAYALARSANGSLFIGFISGELLRRDVATGQSQLFARLPQIRTLATAPDGALWIGTAEGVLSVPQPDRPGPAIFSIVPQPAGRVFALVFDQAGTLWALTSHALQHRSADGSWHVVMPTDSDGGYQVRCMAFAPDGTLWLGSFITGITRLHLAGNTVTGRDSLPSTHIAGLDVELLMRDPTGRIWVGTDRGLDVTDGVSWRHIDTDDGLASNDIAEMATITDRDGSQWFGTAAGLSHLIDSSNLFRPMLLHPVILQSTVGSRVTSGVNDIGATIRLNWSRAPLVIDFSTLDFRYSRSLRFRYRLSGVDAGWVETSAHEARYPDLPPGALTFEVAAFDPLHGLTSEPIALRFQVRAPWWRSWPFYSAAVLLSLLAVAVIWRLRVSYLLARQRHLEALVAERTREIEQARLILFNQATYDGLTGLLNRAACLESLRQAIAHAGTTGSPLAIALVDLDHFKQVNDRYGHLSGDAVLKEIGHRLSVCIRETDFAGRYGGEELLVVLPGLRVGAFGRVQALRKQVFKEPCPIENGAIALTCSIGMTWLRDGDDVTSMIRRADAALYEAKHRGRDRMVFDPPLLDWTA